MALFEAQRIDWIERRSFPSGVEAEEDPNGGAYHKGPYNPYEGGERWPIKSQRQ